MKYIDLALHAYNLLDNSKYFSSFSQNELLLFNVLIFWIISNYIQFLYDSTIS